MKAHTPMKTLTPTPMRQFVDLSSPHRRSWLPVQVSLFLYFVMPLLLIPCVYLSGRWFVEHYHSATSAPAVAPFDEQSADSLITRYVDALGGNKAISQLDHLSFSGAVFTDQDQFTFEGSNARSGEYAVRLYGSDTVVALDFQGVDGIPSSLPSSGGSEAMVTVLKSVFSDFDNPAIRYLEKGDGHVLEVEREKVGRISLICLTIETGPTTSSKLYFDERTMLLIARENYSDGEMLASYRYSNHKSVRGVRLPHTVDAHMKGLPSLQVHYSMLKAPGQSASSLGGGALVLRNNK